MFWSMTMCMRVFFFFFNDTATTEIYTLSLHDALPIYLLGDLDAQQALGELCLFRLRHSLGPLPTMREAERRRSPRSEEHTSELQSRQYLVCRLLLEKKNKIQDQPQHILSAHLPFS